MPAGEGLQALDQLQELATAEVFEGGGGSGGGGELFVDPALQGVGVEEGHHGAGGQVVLQGVDNRVDAVAELLVLIIGLLSPVAGGPPRLAGPQTVIWPPARASRRAMTARKS
jgi:hypothetical protein